MGCTTTVVISNDFFHDLERDPKRFVSDINAGMHDSFSEAADKRGRRNYVMVHAATHATELQLVASQHGLSYPLHRGKYLVEDGDVGSSTAECERLLEMVAESERRLAELRDALGQRRAELIAAAAIETARKTLGVEHETEPLADTMGRAR